MSLKKSNFIRVDLILLSSTFFLFTACNQILTVPANSGSEAAPPPPAHASAPLPTSSAPNQAANQEISQGAIPQAIPSSIANGPHHMSASAISAIKNSSSPCNPIRVLCQDAGFVLDSTTKGNRLIGDCMSKLVTGQSVQSPSGEQVDPPAGANLTACAANIHHGTAPTTGTKSARIPTYTN